MILATNQRDHEFLRLTILVDQFLSERRENDLYNDLGISEKCMLPVFVMWMKDNKMLQFIDFNITE